jgi:hypothetical protein
MKLHRRLSFMSLLVFGALAAPWGVAQAFDVVVNGQGEYADAYLINGESPPRRVAFIDPDPPEPDNPDSPPPRVGRHVNGKLCFFPRGVGHNGQFVMADDTYREACLDWPGGPQPRCSVTRRSSPFYVGKDPDGWAIFRRDGTWTTHHIHTAWDFSSPQPQGNIDPQGCAFDTKGNLWGNDVGSGAFGANDGSLIVFFPGKHHRYDTYCFLDKRLAAPSMPVFDAAGNLYVPETAGFRVTKFSPPFPSSAADCDNPEHLVTTPPTKTTFLGSRRSGETTPAGIVRLPASGNFYVGSVLIPPIINEYDPTGVFVRNIVPENVPRNPLGIDVGADGTLYYAELHLTATLDTGCGSVSMVRFDAAGQPQPPVQLSKNLLFPDGVTVADSARFKVDFTTLPPSPENDPSVCGGE